MKYAPVIIPTLNRYEHFRKCLESLEKCTGAEFTDVYIALDYPPSDKYVDGWKKNDEYLRDKEINNRFKSLTVFRRETNYFFSGKGNAKTAIEDATKKSDSYIFSEDDNVFSLNFLEFINKGLETFKDRSDVYAICGYSHYPIYDFKFDTNNYIFHNTDFSAWGYGIYKDKSTQLTKEVNEDRILQKEFSWRKVPQIYRLYGSYRCLQSIQCGFQYGDYWIHDGVVTIYNIIKGQYLVVPKDSKVRNIGWDNSGQSFSNGMPTKYQQHAKKQLSQTIDDKSTFDFEGDPMAYYEYNNSLAAINNVNNIKLPLLVYRALNHLLRYFVKKIIHY